MSLNTSDEGYNNGKKYGQKGTLCGPNSYILIPRVILKNKVLHSLYTKHLQNASA
jgi:hypothetical protein